MLRAPKARAENRLRALSMRELKVCYERLRRELKICDER